MERTTKSSVELPVLAAIAAAITAINSVSSVSSAATGAAGATLTAGALSSLDELRLNDRDHLKRTDDQ